MLHCHYARGPHEDDDLLAEIASREAEFAAAEAFFEKYAAAPLDEKAIERIEEEYQAR